MNINKFSQLFFVKFPIIFPLIYGAILYTFPSFEKQLILLTILILGETHFGATWPFFLNKFNYSFIKEKKSEFIVIPAMIILLSIVGFFLIKNFFLLIFFIANMFHVTRQSSGVCKLYTKDQIEYKFQATFIYLINIIFFFVAFFRFYTPVIEGDSIIFVNIVFLSILLLASIIYIFKFKFTEKFLTFLTGCLIFYPACFLSNPVHVILMGVTMHYTQYLYLTRHVVISRNTQESNVPKEKNNYIYSFFSIIIIYSIIMTILSSSGKMNDTIYQNLILIPIIGQMLHFYIDSQIWKFREKHNRENTLFHLKKIIN